MCSGLGINFNDFYFGRNLDVECSYNEKIIVTPRNKSIAMRNGKVLDYHFAILGVGISENGFPLYFDAVNEAGLCCAALKFSDSKYRKDSDKKTNIASFEFILYVLSQFENVEEAKREIKNINITDTEFSHDVTPSPLHWILADNTSAITIESTADSLKVYDNKLCVLTNMPEFNIQMFNLNNYMNLTKKMPENKFLKNTILFPYSLGMGALGLPGDFSSMSRFVKLNFVKENILQCKCETECVEQFFHSLDTVAQPLGCTVTQNGKSEYTLYSNCYNATRGICYFKTYFNSEICFVKFTDENLNGSEIKEYKFKNRTSFCGLNE